MLALPFVLRHLHHQLPGRPARLLDHDQHLDDRPAVRDQDAGIGDAEAGLGGGGGERQASVRATRTGGRWRGPPKPAPKALGGGGGGPARDRAAAKEPAADKGAAPRRAAAAAAAEEEEAVGEATVSGTRTPRSRRVRELLE